MKKERKEKKKKKEKKEKEEKEKKSKREREREREREYIGCQWSSMYDLPSLPSPRVVLEKKLQKVEVASSSVPGQLLPTSQVSALQPEISVPELPEAAVVLSCDDGRHDGSLLLHERHPLVLIQVSSGLLPAATAFFAVTSRNFHTSIGMKWTFLREPFLLSHTTLLPFCPLHHAETTPCTVPLASRAPARTRFGVVQGHPRCSCK